MKLSPLLPVLLLATAIQGSTVAHSESSDSEDSRLSANPSAKLDDNSAESDSSSSGGSPKLITFVTFTIDIYTGIVRRSLQSASTTSSQVEAAFLAVLETQSGGTGGASFECTGNDGGPFACEVQASADSTFSATVQAMLAAGDESNLGQFLTSPDFVNKVYDKLDGDGTFKISDITILDAAGNDVETITVTEKPTPCTGNDCPTVIVDPSPTKPVDCTTPGPTPGRSTPGPPVNCRAKPTPAARDRRLLGQSLLLWDEGGDGYVGVGQDDRYAAEDEVSHGVVNESGDDHDDQGGLLQAVASVFTKAVTALAKKLGDAESETMQQD